MNISFVDLINIIDYTHVYHMHVFDIVNLSGTCQIININIHKKSRYYVQTLSTYFKKIIWYIIKQFANNSCYKINIECLNNRWLNNVIINNQFIKNFCSYDVLQCFAFVDNNINIIKNIECFDLDTIDLNDDHIISMLFRNYNSTYIDIMLGKIKNLNVVNYDFDDTLWHAMRNYDKYMVFLKYFGGFVQQNSTTYLEWCKIADIQTINYFIFNYGFNAVYNAIQSSELFFADVNVFIFMHANKYNMTEEEFIYHIDNEDYGIVEYVIDNYAEIFNYNITIDNKTIKNIIKFNDIQMIELLVKMPTSLTTWIYAAFIAATRLKYDIFIIIMDVHNLSFDIDFFTTCLNHKKYSKYLRNHNDIWTIIDKIKNKRSYEPDRGSINMLYCYGCAELVSNIKGIENFFQYAIDVFSDIFIIKKIAEAIIEKHKYNEISLSTCISYMNVYHYYCCSEMRIK